MSRPDVLLVYPPVMRSAPPTDPPFGAMYLAAVLRQAGIKVEILDLNALRWTDEQVENYFREHEFPIVGMGGMTTVYYYVKWLSKIIKESYPRTLTVAGGSLATPCPVEVVEHTGIDVSIVGEGEMTLLELAQKHLAGQSIESVEGIAYQAPNGEVVKTPSRAPLKNLDDLPLPAYDMVDMELYIKNIGKRPSIIAKAERLGIPHEEIQNTFIMFTARGCPFACSFCYRNFGRKVRRHSHAYVIEHMKHVRQRYGVNNVAFFDETFNVNRKWVSEFCHRAPKEMPGNHYWIGGARVDLMDDTQIEELDAAGFYEVSVGVESFDDRLLKEMGKGLTAEQLFTTIRKLQAKKLAPSYLGMIYGYPGDDEESLRVSVKKLIELGIPAYFQFPLPFPGTILYDQIRAQGGIQDVDGFMEGLSDQMTQDLFINLSRFPDDQLVSMVRAAEAEIKQALQPPEPPAGMDPQASRSGASIDLRRGDRSRWKESSVRQRVASSLLQHGRELREQAGIYVHSRSPRVFRVVSGVLRGTDALAATLRGGPSDNA